MTTPGGSSPGTKSVVQKRTKQLDEMTRLASDLSQLTRRVDDFSMRLAVVETHHENFNEKLDDIKRAIEKWNRVGYWLVTIIGGSLILALLSFIYAGGLTAVRAASSGF
jgi:hypothetical protein